MPLEVLRSPPFDVIRCDDPRIRVAHPAVATSGTDTLARLAQSTNPHTVQVLSDAAESLHAWARRVATATLDDLVEALLAAWERLRSTRFIYDGSHPGGRRKVLSVPLRPAVRHAVARRLGLLGERPAPLTACVPGTGIGIQRLRHVTMQIETLANTWIWAPTLDHALELGTEPVDREQYATTLQRQGLTRRRWQPEAVNALARLCGRDQRVAVHPDLDLRRLVDTAKRVVDRERLGVAPVTDVAAAAAAHQQRPVTAQMVTAALATTRAGLVTGGAWVWRAGTGQQAPMLRVARGMLAVAGRLPVATIHSGWRRRLRGRGIHAQPPVEALEAALRTDPGFVVDDQPDGPALVRLAQALRPEQVYGPGALVLIRAIRAAPGHVLTRRELVRAATGAGLTTAQVSRCLAYHEAFTRHGPNLWTLV